MNALFLNKKPSYLPHFSPLNIKTKFHSQIPHDIFIRFRELWLSDVICIIEITKWSFCQILNISMELLISVKDLKIHILSVPASDDYDCEIFQKKVTFLNPQHFTY